MPVRKKVVKKGSAAPSANELQAVKKLAEYAKQMKGRGDWARKILRAQDEKTQEAIQEIVESLSKMADEERIARVTVNGEVVTVKADDEIFEDGWLWVAVRLCMVAHEWDIRVANFKPVRKISKKAGVR